MTTLSIPLVVGDARPTRAEAAALAVAARIESAVARRMADRPERARRAAERARTVEDARASVLRQMAQHPRR